MVKFLPLFPFVAALALLACGKRDPVAEDAAAPPDNVVGDASAEGLDAPANSAAAEAVQRQALPPMNAGMAWVAADDGRSASYGPPNSEGALTVGCDAGGIVVTRHHPASLGGKATLSLTGAGQATSLPMVAVPTTIGPGEAQWQGRAIGDIARAVERPFTRDGQVEITLGGAPSLVVPANGVIRGVFDTCLRG